MNVNHCSFLAGFDSFHNLAKKVSNKNLQFQRGIYKKKGDKIGMGHMHVGKEYVASLTGVTNTCTQAISYKPYIVAKIVFMIYVSCSLVKGSCVIM